MTTVTNQAGKQIDFDAAAQLMDNNIRETLSTKLAPCTDQEFMTAYEKEHAAQHGEAWELSKANPTW